MVKLSKIARVNALDAYFPKNRETAVSAEIDFELVRDSKLNQLATWPNKINEFQKHIKVLKIHNDYLKSGVVCHYGNASVVRVEPFKWWVLDDYSGSFNFDQENFVTNLDLSHSFVRVKMSGIFSNQILAHHVPVDLREAQFPVDKLITTSMHHVSIKLWRKQNYWQIFLPRSFSESLWQLLSETAEQYGFKKRVL